MDLIHHERIKLLATFLNSTGVAVFAVGGVSPLFFDAIRREPIAGDCHGDQRHLYCYCV